MKAKHIFSIFIAIAFSLTGCGGSNQNTNNEESTHSHTYSSEWSHDGTYHWHPATCEHTNEVKDKEEHRFGSWIIDSDATEYQIGSKHKICEICEFRIDETIPVLEHTHKAGNPVEENRHEASCTENGSYDLVIYCSECHQEMNRESHNINALGHHLVHRDSKTATCTEAGWGEYDYCDRDGCNYSTKVEIPATGHLHTATREENVVPETCTENGSYDLVTYCEDDNAVISTEHKVILATGHNWGAPSYEWEFGEYLVSCTAKRICTNNSTHIESETKYASSSTISDPTYSETGLKRYTVTFSNTAFETQTRDVELPIKDMLKYVLSGNGTYYTVSADSTSIYGDIVIPAIHNELPVKVIDSFFNCSNITSVTIPDSVETINGNAFQSCTSLATVQMGNNVKSVGYYAFSECPITSIIIPDSATSLGFCAFYGCENLKTVYIGQNVESLDSVLQGCDSIENLTIPYIGGSKTANQYLCYLYGYAYYAYNVSVTSLKKLTILNSCESIDNHALEGCPNLETLTIPFIGGSATENQYLGYIFGATSVDDNGTKVPTSIKTINLSSACLTIPDKAFVNCASIEEINIGDNVNSIGWRSYYGCSSIESIVVPASVTNIGNSAFGSMSSLVSVIILGDNVTIGLSVFSGSPNLAQIRVPASNINYSVNNDILYNKDGTRLICCPAGLSGAIIVPNTVTSIEEYAFYGCDKITSITLPSSIAEFENNTFTNCTSLESINIPEGLTTIGKTVFGYCSSLEEINLPSTLLTMGEYCFGYCSSLKNIEIPASVQTLEKAIFLECSSLKSVTLHGGLKTIGLGAFLRCSALEGVDVPDSVTTIGAAAFEGCTSITSFEMPYYVTNISQELFSGCTSLKEITLSVYDYGTIGKSAFYNCTSLETIELPGITSLADYAFYGCASLWGIGFDETLSSIGNYCLYNCTKLTDIYYAGTTTQWAGVTKGTSWKYGVTATTIVCSNGNASL